MARDIYEMTLPMRVLVYALRVVIYIRVCLSMPSVESRHHP